MMIAGGGRTFEKDRPIVNRSVSQAGVGDPMADFWPQNLSRETYYPFGRVSLSEYLSRWAERTPNKAAVVFYGAVTTFAELNQRSGRLAGFLRDCGVLPGDRVAVYLPNSPHALIAFHGVLKSRAVYVPVNMMLKEHEFDAQLADSGATVLIADESLLETVKNAPMLSRMRLIVTSTIAEQVPDKPTIPLHPTMMADPRTGGPLVYETVPMSQILASDVEWIDEEVPLDDLAALNYTGGTTGAPKGCEHTQGHMVDTGAKAASFSGPWTHDDVMLTFVPLSWIAGQLKGIIVPTVLGATAVIMTRWDPVGVLSAIDAYKVTTLAGSAGTYIELMESPRAKDYDVSSVRDALMSSFGARLTPRLRRRWSEFAGPQSILREAGYGLTETGGPVTFGTGFEENDGDLFEETIFCGMVMPGDTVRIVGPDLKQELPPGETGQILVATPSLMKGYWQQCDLGAFAPGQTYATGDLGFMDERGCLHLVGRLKELLKVKGVSVYPSEVEHLMMRHPDVASAAVVGEPDPVSGQKVVAFVALGDDASALDEAELHQWCRDNMSTYKVPEIIFVRDLPRTSSGKVRKGLISRATMQDLVISRAQVR